MEFLYVILLVGMKQVHDIDISDFDRDLILYLILDFVPFELEVKHCGSFFMEVGMR
jgi:hypothetical protein